MILRVVVLVACLFSAGPAFAQPVGLTSGSAVTGTSGSMVPGMKPGVPGTPGAKHPYFFAAYAVVWLVLFAYVLWLANRIKTLERRR